MRVQRTGAGCRTAAKMKQGVEESAPLLEASGVIKTSAETPDLKPDGEAPAARPAAEETADAETEYVEPSGVRHTYYRRGPNWPIATVHTHAAHNGL